MSSSKGDGEAAAKKKLDPFLASMTFAHGVMRNCDCDECGLESVPPSIAAAVRKHKRAKLMSIVEITQQERTLVARDGGLSIWQFKFPVGAEPMIEFGNSHRIVLVEKLPSNMNVKKIGAGIVGSKAEEEGRMCAQWENGHGYFIPSNGGKAVGWVCVSKEESSSSKDDEKKSSSSDDEKGGAVEVYMIKATSEALTAANKDRKLQSWAQSVREIFKEEVQSMDKASDDTSLAVQPKCVAALREHIKKLAP